MGMMTLARRFTVVDSWYIQSDTLAQALGMLYLDHKCILKHVLLLLVTIIFFKLTREYGPHVTEVE